MYDLLHTGRRSRSNHYELLLFSIDVSFLFSFFSSQGLSDLEELQQRYTHLEKLYNDVVRERDEAIEERDKATVLIALQLQTETEALNKQVDALQSQNNKLTEDNEDLKIRLGYAKEDLNKLQQRHIKLQIEQEQCLQEKENALVLLGELENKILNEGVKEETKQVTEEVTSGKMVREQTRPRAFFAFKMAGRESGEGLWYVPAKRVWVPHVRLSCCYL